MDLSTINHEDELAAHCLVALSNSHRINSSFFSSLPTKKFMTTSEQNEVPLVSLAYHDLSSSQVTKKRRQPQTASSTVKKARKVPNHLPLVSSYVQSDHLSSSRLLSPEDICRVQHDLKDSPTSSLSSFPSSPSAKIVSLQNHFSCRQDSLADSSGSDDRQSPLSSSCSSSPAVVMSEAVDLTSRGCSVSDASKILKLILPSSSSQVDRSSSVNLLTQKATSFSSSCLSCSSSSSHQGKQADHHHAHLQLNCSLDPSSSCPAVLFTASSCPPSFSSQKNVVHHLTQESSHSPESYVKSQVDLQRPCFSQEANTALFSQESIISQENKNRHPQDDEESPFMVARILADLCSIKQEPLPREEEETAQQGEDERRLVIDGHDSNSQDDEAVTDITSAPTSVTHSSFGETFEGIVGRKTFLQSIQHQEGLAACLLIDRNRSPHDDRYCHEPTVGASSSSLSESGHFANYSNFNERRIREDLVLQATQRQISCKNPSTLPSQKSVKSRGNINDNHSNNSEFGSNLIKRTCKSSRKKSPAVTATNDDNCLPTWNSCILVDQQHQDLLVEQNSPAVGPAKKSGSSTSRHACTFVGCDKVYGKEMCV